MCQIQVKQWGRQQLGVLQATNLHLQGMPSSSSTTLNSRPLYMQQ
jgi:hypothetical protein